MFLETDYSVSKNRIYGGNMSIPKWKKRESELDYVDNSYILQGDIMNLASKLSARWARIYQQPIDRLACLRLI